MNLKNSTTAEEEIRIRKQRLAEAINDIKKDYTSKENSDIFKILGSVINSLAVASAAQVLKKGTPALLLSLQIALQGIEKEESEAGIIGSTLNKATKGVVELVIHTFLGREDIGSRNLFKLMMQGMMLASIAITWKLKQFRLNSKSDANTESDQENKLFEFEMILLLILKSGIIQEIVKNVSSTCGANENQQEIIGNLMKALLLILMVLTAANGNEKYLRSLVVDLKDYLIEAMSDIQNFVNIAREAEKTGDTAPVMNIFIQQALSSLQDENFETTFQAYSAALAEVKATPEMMVSEIEEIENFAELIYNAFTRGSIDLSRMTATHMI